MVELGKDLYFDPRLSQSHNISCNTCHQIGLGGVDMLPVSIGHKWQKGGTQCTHGAERRFQRGAVLGWARR